VPGSNVKLTAVADAFQYRVDGALKAVEKMKDKVDCPEDRRFTGLDAAQKLIDLPDVDLVILATPPGFRPFHFDAAIKAGKHVFMEKPVCVDSFGARLVLEAAKLADEKKRKVVVGLQRRYENKYRETIARIREGLAGEIIGGQVYWNGSGICTATARRTRPKCSFRSTTGTTSTGSAATTSASSTSTTSTWPTGLKIVILSKRRALEDVPCVQAKNMEKFLTTMSLRSPMRMVVSFTLSAVTSQELPTGLTKPSKGPKERPTSVRATTVYLLIGGGT